MSTEWKSGLSEKVHRICKRYWKKLPNGMPAKTCCHGCPIYQPCNSGGPTTPRGIADYRKKMNAAAELVAEE
jgi:hypothetical protein